MEVASSPPLPPPPGEDTPRRAKKNRTLSCNSADLARLTPHLITPSAPLPISAMLDRIIQGDSFAMLAHLPPQCVDLLILDPPYNLSKNYHGHLFKAQDQRTYQDWFEALLQAVKPLLKANASLYACADWTTSILIAPLLAQHFYLRNRITWERDKGRGAQRNWKNNSEDIWFCTCATDYTFNVEAVKLKRKVIAPYKIDGQPKDWTAGDDGNYRLTHPANLWTDITVPFWSMPENTDHPTQKPEKLIAKLILASSNCGDLVFDPFLGSGTTAVVAKKLQRHFGGIEQNPEYCCWALKRLERAATDPLIQGYSDGVFWERNSQHGRK